MTINVKYNIGGYLHQMTNACKEPARCFLRGLRPRSSMNSWSTSLYSYAGNYNNLQAGELVRLTSGKLALLDCDTGGTCAVRNYDGPHGFPRPLIFVQIRHPKRNAHGKQPLLEQNLAPPRPASRHEAAWPLPHTIRVPRPRSPTGWT